MRKRYDRAAMDLTRAMITSKYKRGVVAVHADYYDPRAVLEMKRT